MKNLFLTLVLILTTAFTFSQTESKTLQPYLALGVSLSDGTFNDNSYPSVELGTMVGDYVSFGLVVGRGNFTGIFSDTEVLENYWYEGKVQAILPLGDVINVYGLFGYGAYYNTSLTNDNFIEYGGGLSKQVGRVTVFLQFSNWDEVNYVTPGLSFNL